MPGGVSMNGKGDLLGNSVVIYDNQCRLIDFKGGMMPSMIIEHFMTHQWCRRRYDGLNIIENLMELWLLNEYEDGLNGHSSLIAFQQYTSLGKNPLE